MNPKTLLILAIAMPLLLAGCLQQNQSPTNLPPSGPAIWNQTSISAPTPTPGPKTGIEAVFDNMLKALNNDDYAVFMNYSSERFNATLTKNAFVKFRTQVLNLTGNYESAASPSFYGTLGFIFFSFPTQFQYDSVNTTLVINATTGLIEGIVFDSPLLRAVAQSNTQKIRVNSTG